ncbi:hypothetical protein SSBR45G_01630 [Bradyrhizobium sp. SSBR45G]|nr:hypothetical protein SSBR45G_01630 [Bradyrhizobium sp. SSBR45G]GLH82958.1 hypothetical protein SSBR45R_04180 [Bradyrhizobium sp. SSBR45R]
MRARLLVSFVAIVGVLAVNSLNAGAGEATTEGVKARPAAADAQKYRPKQGCFGTGTQDPAGRTQVVCR